MPSAFVPFTNVVKYAVRCTQQGQQVENIYHAQFAAAPTPSSMLTTAGVIKTWWNTSIKPLSSGNVKLVEIQATDLTTITGTSVSYTTGMPIQGTNSGNDLPMNATVAVKWSTSFRGRSYRGRTYHIGLLIEQVDQSILKAATVTSLTTAYEALRTTMESDLTPLVVASRIGGGVLRITGVATLILSASVEATVDSQRRRLPGRGR